MDGALKGAFHKTRHKGASIVESLILMIVLGLTFGAMFMTLGWAHKTHIYSRTDRASRELFFSWVQAFDAAWQPAIEDNSVHLLETRANGAIAAAANMMSGTPPVVTGGIHRTQIGGFIIEVSPQGIIETGDRSLNLDITIRTGNRDLVNLARSFSGFPNPRVRDWGEENVP